MHSQTLRSIEIPDLECLELVTIRCEDHIMGSILERLNYGGGQGWIAVKCKETTFCLHHPLRTMAIRMNSAEGLEVTMHSGEMIYEERET